MQVLLPVPRQMRGVLPHKVAVVSAGNRFYPHENSAGREICLHKAGSGGNLIPVILYTVMNTVFWFSDHFPSDNVYFEDFFFLAVIKML